ncbi:nitrate- and nitrite sensing domain-containing protein [Streptomyces sp. MS06]|uniref:sensor histidine kinase n=1 Tax=Streptomyces sp. MS06 TaxID=3385974 RepID=UPI0039A27ADA
MQGRFKRDGSASAEPEPHGGTDRGSSPQHAQNQGPAQVGEGGERPGATGSASGPPSGPAAPVVRSKGATGPGPRIALRNWRISTRLVSLLALPVVAATTLGALRISGSMEDMKQLDNMKLLTDMTTQATELAAALQEERDQSAGPLAHHGSASDYTVKGYRDRTDRAKENFLTASEQVEDNNLQGVRDSVVGIARDLNTLSKIRQQAFADADQGNATQTVEAYHRLITHLLDLSQDMAQATSNPEMIQRTRALAAFSAAKEYASMQRAVLASALPANNTTYGNLSSNDRAYAESALESQKSELNSFRSIYGTSNAEELLKPIEEGNPTIEATDLYAGRALGRSEGLKGLEKRSYRDWVDDSSVKIQQMKNIEHRLLEEMEQKARTLRAESEREAIISGALILLVLGVSLVGAFVVARSMIRSLRRLEDTATRVAQDRLPELVKQLSEADPQDVDTSVESVGVHSRDEIGRVAAAFDDVHREAVRLAAEQALLRGNVNAMFTNLSRRSQGLIQRQLSLISELESREADPDQLSSLFKLDHLATRMRRNGENLLVLAGEEPGRRWTRPVPLVDVLRAAASEVEQYERIELAAVPSTEVAGRVVNDLVHLLAELLENATSFSSPQTKVKVTGHALPDGRVLIEIHDTGIGLSPEDLAAINERLASPPTVDVSVSRRMGLFVVGRLSQRHGIRIQLRPSDSGGTTALVMLPVDVAQGGKKPQGKGGQGAGNAGGPAAAQAAAGAAAARRQAQSGQQHGAVGAGPSGAGRLGAGQGPRAALPGRDGGRPGAPGGAPGPQSPAAPQQGRPTAGAGAPFGQSPAAPPQGLQSGGAPAPEQDAFGAGRGTAPGQRPQDDSGAEQGRRGRRPQLPPRAGQRPELPGAEPQRTPGWGGEAAQPPVPRASLDAPRGHDEPDVTATSRMPRIDAGQGPGSTAEIPRFDERQVPGGTGEFPRPGAEAPRQNGRPGDDQFMRSDVFGAPAGPSGGPDGPSSTGQFAAPQAQDSGTTGEFRAPGYEESPTGRHSLPGRPDGSGGTGQFERPQPQTGGYGYPQQPSQQPQNGYGYPQPSTQQPQNGYGYPQQPSQQPQSGYGYPQPGQQRAPRPEAEALPPATGPADGRTPLYDTLETNWFRGGGSAGAAGQQGNGSAPAPRQQPPQPAAPPQQRGPQTAAWRTSPNDDLVRQAERVRQPAAGGVTTSGLPRRVPRANLVPGTAQQQQHQTGPQVSRAPDDVRGRLTNLRRGIAQGRSAGTGPATGNHPSPTHQQER